MVVFSTRILSLFLRNNVKFKNFIWKQNPCNAMKIYAVFLTENIGFHLMMLFIWSLQNFDILYINQFLNINSTHYHVMQAYLNYDPCMIKIFITSITRLHRWKYPIKRFDIKFVKELYVLKSPDTKKNDFRKLVWHRGLHGPDFSGWARPAWLQSWPGPARRKKNFGAGPAWNRK